MLRKFSNHHRHHDQHDHDQIAFIVDQAPSSSQTPYLVPTADGVWFTSVLTAGDAVGLKPDGVTPWRMVGVPDGLGAFDNGDGTLTVLMNHELPNTSGVVRGHGSVGAFVSKLVIDKNTLEVKEAGDLAQKVLVYDTATDTYVPAAGAELAFNRLCSGDLPAPSALVYYDGHTAYGTQERIYFAGEETGPPFDARSGRAFAFQVTDKDGDANSEAGTAFELARFGNMAFENILLNPHSQLKTVAITSDDTSPGELYLYVGQKQATGANEFEKAGLTNGKLFGILTSWGDDGLDNVSRATGTFSLAAQGNNGDVSDYDPGVTASQQLQAEAGPLTQFGRPEDGQWDPSNPNRFYFVTTGIPVAPGTEGTTNGPLPAPSRLWVMEFYDVEHPELGGTIKMLLDGSEGYDMLDNMTVTESGLVIMQEDPGSAARLAKVWMYDPNADTRAPGSATGNSGLTELGQHDPARFTAPGTAPFNTNEESSGVTDVTSLLGHDQRLAFLLDTQAHFTVGGELVEGGQLQVMYVDLPNPGNSRFKGGGSADVYDGGFGNDCIDGGKGDDTLLGNYGNDKIEGGDGNDKLDGGVGKDRIDGGKGHDTIAGGTRNDRLYGGDGNDNVDGGVGNDKVDGGKGQDVVKGGFGNDAVFGGDDGDLIDGGHGLDFLVGGKGDDTFYFASVTQGPDKIADFRPGHDKIKIDVSVDPAAVAFVGFEDGAGGPGSGPALFYNKHSGFLSFRESASSELVHIATLVNDPALHKADVWLV